MIAKASTLTLRGHEFESIERVLGKKNPTVIYSLDTCKFITCKDNCEDEVASIDFFQTRERLLAIWIDPTWSSTSMD